MNNTDAQNKAMQAFNSSSDLFAWNMIAQAWSRAYQERDRRKSWSRIRAKLKKHKGQKFLIKQRSEWATQPNAQQCQKLKRELMIRMTETGPWKNVLQTIPSSVAWDVQWQGLFITIHGAQSQHSSQQFQDDLVQNIRMLTSPKESGPEQEAAAHQIPEPPEASIAATVNSQNGLSMTAASSESSLMRPLATHQDENKHRNHEDMAARPSVPQAQFHATEAQQDDQLNHQFTEVKLFCIKNWWLMIMLLPVTSLALVVVALDYLVCIKLLQKNDLILFNLWAAKPQQAATDGWVASASTDQQQVTQENCAPKPATASSFLADPSVAQSKKTPSLDQHQYKGLPDVFYATTPMSVPKNQKSEMSPKQQVILDLSITCNKLIKIEGCKQIEKKLRLLTLWLDQLPEDSITSQDASFIKEFCKLGQDPWRQGLIEVNSGQLLSLSQVHNSPLRFIVLYSIYPNIVRAAKGSVPTTWRSVAARFLLPQGVSLQSLHGQLEPTEANIFRGIQHYLRRQNLWPDQKKKYQKTPKINDFRASFTRHCDAINLACKADDLPQALQELGQLFLWVVNLNEVLSKQIENDPKGREVLMQVAQASNHTPSLTTCLGLLQSSSTTLAQPFKQWLDFWFQHESMLKQQLGQTLEGFSLSYTSRELTELCEKLNNMTDAGFALHPEDVLDNPIIRRIEDSAATQAKDRFNTMLSATNSMIAVMSLLEHYDSEKPASDWFDTPYFTKQNMPKLLHLMQSRIKMNKPEGSFQSFKTEVRHALSFDFQDTNELSESTNFYSPSR